MNSLKKAVLALALGGALAGTPITAQSTSDLDLRDRIENNNNLTAGGVEEAIEALAEALGELADFVTQLAMDVEAGFAAVTQAFNDVYATIGDVATALGEAIAAHDMAMQARVEALGDALGQGFTALGQGLANHDAANAARVEALGQGLSAHDMNMTEQHILIGEAIAAIQQQNVRLHIERNLGTGPDPTLNRIALFQIPQAQGGFLETIRGILADTIAKQTAAGIGINPFVQTEINAGDFDYSLGNFKQAYDHYRTAYLGLASL